MSAARQNLYTVTCASEPEWRWPCKSRRQVRSSVAGHLKVWLHRPIVLKRGRPAARDGRFDDRVDAAFAAMSKEKP